MEAQALIPVSEIRHDRAKPGGNVAGRAPSRMAPYVVGSSGLRPPWNRPTSSAVARPQQMASHRTPVKVEPWPRWVRAFLEGDGRPVVDSKRVLLVIEPRALPVFYLPRRDVRMDLLIPNGHTKESPHLGQAVLFDLITKDRKV